MPAYFHPSQNNGGDFTTRPADVVTCDIFLFFDGLNWGMFLHFEQYHLPFGALIVTPFKFAFTVVTTNALCVFIIYILTDTEQFYAVIR